LSNEEIVELLDKMDKHVKAFEEELIQLAWAMRGGVTLNEAYGLSPTQRKQISKLFKENVETAKNSGLSFF